MVIGEVGWESGDLVACFPACPLNGRRVLLRVVRVRGAYACAPTSRVGRPPLAACLRGLKRTKSAQRLRRATRHRAAGSASQTSTANRKMGLQRRLT